MSPLTSCHSQLRTDRPPPVKNRALLTRHSWSPPGRNSWWSSVNRPLPIGCRPDGAPTNVNRIPEPTAPAKQHQWCRRGLALMRASLRDSALLLCGVNCQVSTVHRQLVGVAPMGLHYCTSSARSHGSSYAHPGCRRGLGRSYVVPAGLRYSVVNHQSPIVQCQVIVSVGYDE